MKQRVIARGPTMFDQLGLAKVGRDRQRSGQLVLTGRRSVDFHGDPVSRSYLISRMHCN